MDYDEQMTAAFFDEMDKLAAAGFLAKGLTGWAKAFGGAGAKQKTVAGRIMGAGDKKRGIWDSVKHHYGAGSKGKGGIWGGIKRVHEKTPLTAMAGTAAIPVGAGALAFGGNRYYLGR